MALVRPLVRVNTHVVFQITRLTKSFIAHITLVRFLVRVNMAKLDGLTNIFSHTSHSCCCVLFLFVPFFLKVVSSFRIWWFASLKSSSSSGILKHNTKFGSSFSPFKTVLAFTALFGRGFFRLLVSSSFLESLAKKKRFFRKSMVYWEEKKLRRFSGTKRKKRFFVWPKLFRFATIKFYPYLSFSRVFSLRTN